MGEVLTEEEIKKRATLKVIPYLTNEVNEKWPNFKEKSSHVCFVPGDNTRFSKSESIVSVDLWEQVQEKLKNTK